LFGTPSISATSLGLGGVYVREAKPFSSRAFTTAHWNLTFYNSLLI